MYARFPFTKSQLFNPFYLVILTFWFPIYPTEATWRILGISSIATAHEFTKDRCKFIPNLTQTQRRICNQNPHLIRSIKAGAVLSMEECQSQFQNDRWNCTIEDDNSTLWDNFMKASTQESAFMYAITTAGMLHSITSACSMGNFTDCHCDRTQQGLMDSRGWQWGGCSDNLSYGTDFTHRFIDIVDSNPNITRNVANLHNNEVGRQAIIEQMQVQCRCHGVSGACTLKTCWNSVPTFTNVGDYLKERYKNAVRVLKKLKDGNLKRKDKATRREMIETNELVFVKRSPNYCRENNRLGVLGTSERICNKTGDAVDSCDILCCGRGYNTMVERRVERCECKFIWCCFVKCRQCESMVDIHSCK